MAYEMGKVLILFLGFCGCSQAFRYDYVMGCGSMFAHNFTSPTDSAHLTSSNYPGVYPADCHSIIRFYAPQGYQVYL